ncbi:MAG: hypothetical protein H0T62_05525 [Parachlamydiaceae bacterium]|nr:hypothetical protein [Parachlamydiaceae bacterium]
MIFSDFSIYRRDKILPQYDTHNGTTSSSNDYILQLERLLKVMEDVAKSIEYGVKINTPSLSTSDKLLIYKNIKPYFQISYPNGAPQRTRYTDVLILNGREDPNSIFNFVPKEIVLIILKLKNQVPFMNFPDFIKFIPKG